MQIQIGSDNEVAAEKAVQRLRGQRDIILKLRSSLGGRDDALDIADIGTGVGTSAMLWAELGHRVIGVDIDKAAIDVAKKRATASALDIRFKNASATDLPIPDKSVDICVASELLEHVADWESCLNEFARILRPNSVQWISTTNRLCPKQNEFNLVGYSWYPGILKRHFERVAVTTRPQIANYTMYPAVNWFTHRGLKSALRCRGFVAFYDGFDLAALKDHSGIKRFLLNLISHYRTFRWLAYVLTPATIIVAIGKKEE